MELMHLAWADPLPKLREMDAVGAHESAVVLLTGFSLKETKSAAKSLVHYN